jgi:uncharacterized coiled-coil DUF342 family protein
MELFMAEDSDSLASLEERITRAVQLVMSLREQNAELHRKLESAVQERDSLKAERDNALGSIAQYKQSSVEGEKYKAELDQLKNERRNVRNRIEKLLGQMDLLGNQ